jgi:cell shape-determining protein MreC
MSYHRDNNKFKLYKTSFIVVLVFAIFYFWGGGILNVASSIVVGVSTPVLKIGVSTKNGLVSYFSVFSFKKNLYEENDSLKKENEAIKLRLIGVDELYIENKKLKSILGRAEDRKLILASVLSRPNSSPYDSLIIDAGKNLNIQNGDTVVVGGDISIGAVSYVYGKSSKVELFSNPNNSMDVLVGESNIATSAKGKGAGNFEIELPRDISIKIGDIVSAPSIDVKMLGVVEYIDINPSNPFQKILFKSPVNIRNIKWVQIIKSQN